MIKKSFSISLRLILPVLLLAPLMVNAQPVASVTDSELLKSYFDEIFGADERLVSGPLYYGATRGSIQGHPYYFDDSYKDGSVQTGNARFDHLQLKYDILIKQVILKYQASDNAAYQVGLRSSLITRLTIGSSVFIPLPFSRDSTAVPFAEVLAEGTMSYLMVKDKDLVLTSGAGTTDYVYKENIRQYLYIGNSLVPFRGKKTLFSLYPKFKTNLKQYLRSNRIGTGQKNIYGRVEMVNYFNTLIDSSDE